MSGGAFAVVEEADWQRLDQWLWCARFLRHRADCARLAGAGGIRVNRQPTDKPHARLRIGDTLTLPLPRGVLVIEVLALAGRRGPAAQARTLYREIPPPGGAAAEAQACGRQACGAQACESGADAAYPPALPTPPIARSAR